MFTECGNGFQYLEPSTKRKTQLTEMILREVRQDALVEEEARNQRGASVSR
jgi:hypothetical protein